MTKNKQSNTDEKSSKFMKIIASFLLIVIILILINTALVKASSNTYTDNYVNIDSDIVEIKAVNILSNSSNLEIVTIDDTQTINLDGTKFYIHSKPNMVLVFNKASTPETSTYKHVYLNQDQFKNLYHAYFEANQISINVEI